MPPHGVWKEKRKRNMLWYQRKDCSIAQARDSAQVKYKYTKEITRNFQYTRLEKVVYITHVEKSKLPWLFKGKTTQTRN
jgi:hypothetical protein